MSSDEGDSELHQVHLGGGLMQDKHFSVPDFLEPAALLERFLSDCEALSDEMKDEKYSFTYVADTVAAIYYHREYESADAFIMENREYIDEERAEWVKYMWRTMDTLSEEQKASIVIESLTQMPAAAEF